MGTSPLLSRHLPYPHHRPKMLAPPPKLDLSKLRTSMAVEPGSNRKVGVRLSAARPATRIKTLLTPRLRPARTPRLPGGAAGPGSPIPSPLHGSALGLVGAGAAVGGNVVQSLVGGFVSPGAAHELSDHDDRWGEYRVCAADTRHGVAYGLVPRK